MDELLAIVVSALVGGIVGGGAIAKLAFGALENQLRVTFQTSGAAEKMEEDLRGDLDGVGRKVERNAGLFVALDDRTGDLEEKVSVLEERQSQEQRRTSEQINQAAEMIRDAMKEVRAVTSMVHDLALRLERLDAQHTKRRD